MIPHAAVPLCAAANAGVPTNAAPATAHSGVRTCARYQCGGSVDARCGSLASRGLPVAVREALNAQLLEPPPNPAAALNVARSRSSACTAAPAVRATGKVTGSHSGYDGSRARSASGPSSVRILRRASSESQLDARLNAMSLSTARTSAASYVVGLARSSANSCGRRRNPCVAPVVTPQAYASSMLRVSLFSTANCFRAASRNPILRERRSTGSPGFPTSSASVPRATRIRPSIWNVLSCP